MGLVLVWVLNRILFIFNNRRRKREKEEKEKGRGRKIYSKELVHVIVEAEKSKIKSDDLRTRKADDVDSIPRLSLKVGEE